MKIELISPRPDDAGFWLRIRQQRSTQENNPVGVLDEAALAKMIEESNQPFSAKMAAHRFFIALENGEHAGFISLYGKRLIGYAEERAKVLGLPFIGLHSSFRRKEAHQFYKATGFEAAKESYFFTKGMAILE